MGSTPQLRASPTQSRHTITTAVTRHDLFVSYNERRVDMSTIITGTGNYEWYEKTDVWIGVNFLPVLF